MLLDFLKKSGRIIKKSKWYLEECWIVKYLPNEQIEFFIYEQIELIFYQSRNKNKTKTKKERESV